VTLAAGTRLGPYEIQTPIGAGGMGEVYRARDTRLERTVAVKVLPTHLSASPESRQRFEREAKTISRLSHPHICALYDVGREGETEYLVMEYLEGETLLDRLAKGALPLEQTLRYGTEIADALEKAHRQGIVHRDLKPANVMLTKTGVKLLDFGLAKGMEAPGSKGSLTSLPTQQGLTQEGTILGTFQYMAPEQLEGKEADARTDIFAFGATLYEMATGKKAFAAATQASLIGAILHTDPAPISAVHPMSPPALDRVVKTCLAKDPEDRWQNAGDVGKELRWIAEGSAAGMTVPAAASRPRVREAIAWALAAAGLLAGATSFLTRGRGTGPQSVRFLQTPPAGFAFRFQDRPAVSPDGRRIAFSITDGGGRTRIWVRNLDTLSARVLEGTEGGSFAFWSPDGRQLGFFQAGKLRRIDAEGGSIQTICEDTGGGFGATWGTKGVIVLGSHFGTPLSRVPADGGARVPVTVIDPARGDAAHVYPAFLPDGRHFVFAARNVDPAKTVLVVADIDSNETRVLWRSDTTAVWSPRGYLLFAREGALFAQRFDPAKLEAVGAPMTVVDDVHFFTDNNLLQVSAGGDVLAYGLWRHDRNLVWLDRKGTPVGTLGQVADYEDLRISPKGDRVAVSIRDATSGRNLDVWVLDVARGIASRLTSDRPDEFVPTWSADGQRVYYTSDRAGFYDIYAKPASGGAEEVVLKTNWDKLVSDVTPDGSALVLGGSPSGTREDVWLLPLAGNRKAKPLFETEFTEYSARLSPDGRWIAFSSDDAGPREIFVQAFPSGPRRRVSTSGGSSPVWSRDGKELFYAAGDGRLTAVPFRPDASGPVFGPPQPLFDLGAAGLSSYDPRPYDVSPDGRFLVVRVVGEEPSNPTVIDVHWTERLKK
jgi:Tol biopolymer transport system component